MYKNKNRDRKKMYFGPETTQFPETNIEKKFPI